MPARNGDRDVPPSDPALHRIAAGDPVDLSAIDPGDVSLAPGDRAATEEATQRLSQRLADLQRIFWARQRERLLVVLQGMDTSGKGGTIEHVFGAVNPAGLHVVSFRAPTEPELARDYLWRVHPHVPSDGQIAVFDRSHYEDVLVARVEGLVPKARWRKRYEHIAAFERLLADEGTTIVKVLLHISKKEQKARLESRLEEPHKHWKFRRGDLDSRQRWDDYRAAFEEAVERTTAPHAPWHVIPADRKWYRNWAVATVVTGVLEEMDLTWPAPAEDLRGVVVE